VRSLDHEALRYVVFSTPLLPRPSWTQISSSASYCRIPWAYAPPSLWQTKCHARMSYAFQVLNFKFYHSTYCSQNLSAFWTWICSFWCWTDKL